VAYSDVLILMNIGGGYVLCGSLVKVCYCIAYRYTVTGYALFIYFLICMQYLAAPPYHHSYYIISFFVEQEKGFHINASQIPYWVSY